MTLTIQVLGLTLLHLEVTTDEPDDDTARDLSGGTLAGERIEGGPVDAYMGFTGGREIE